MSKRIDWYYHRKGWTTCKRADAFLEEAGATVRETVNATKERFGADDLAQLFADATTVVAAKGKKITVIQVNKDEDAAELLSANALGPTGNLRAPTLRIGKRWLIGFNEDEYRKIIR